MYQLDYNIFTRFLYKVLFRETREGWSVLTVETEVNVDPDKEYKLVGLLGLSCQYKRFCSALTA
jgi:hypothetical protein